MKVVSLREKQLVFEAGHSPQPVAEVKNAWSYISAPPYIILSWCLSKHRDDFTAIYP
jgi:hypothetical protein